MIPGLVQQLHVGSALKMAARMRHPPLMFHPHVLLSLLRIEAHVFEDAHRTSLDDIFILEQVVQH